MNNNNHVRNSCGKLWTEHLGIMDTCAKLIDTKSVLDDALAIIVAYEENNKHCSEAWRILQNRMSALTIEHEHVE